MNKKFQIFVSSTFIDLEEERRAVIEAILDLGHIPIGMEAFQASNEEQWSYIKKRIDESDYYVLLVAERYGSEKDGVSYTEMEYDYAREKGVPVAAFLLAEDARKDWRARKADFIDNTTKINAFRSKCQGLLVRHWKNKDDLAASCVKSVMAMIRDFPRDGWVPAKEAINPDVANELARLSRENEELREKLSKDSGYRDVDLTIKSLNEYIIHFDDSQKLTALEVFKDTYFRLLFGINLFEGGNVKRLYIENGRVHMDNQSKLLGLNTITVFVAILKLHYILHVSRINSDTEIYELTDFGKRVVHRAKETVWKKAR